MQVVQSVDFRLVEVFHGDCNLCREQSFHVLLQSLQTGVVLINAQHNLQFDCAASSLVSKTVVGSRIGISQLCTLCHPGKCYGQAFARHDGTICRLIVDPRNTTSMVSLSVPLTA